MVVKHIDEGTPRKIVYDAIMRYDTVISLGAKGVYGQLCGLPSNWETTINGLTGLAKVNRKTVRGYVQELEIAEYVVRNRIMDIDGRPIDAKGHYTTTIFKVYSDPKCLLGQPPKACDTDRTYEGNIRFDTHGMYEKNFTLVPRGIDGDYGVSYKAKAMYHILCSLKPWEETTEREIAKFCKEEEGAVRTALKELEYHKYLERVEVRNEKGEFVRNDYHIYGDPKEICKVGFRKKEERKGAGRFDDLYDTDYAALVGQHGREYVDEAVSYLRYIRILSSEAGLSNEVYPKNTFKALRKVCESDAFERRIIEMRAVEEYAKTLPRALRDDWRDLYGLTPEMRRLLNHK